MSIIRKAELIILVLMRLSCAHQNGSQDVRLTDRILLRQR